MRQSCRLLGVPITNQYQQHVVHPHVSHNRLDVHRMLQFVEPTSATTCRYHNYVFGLDHYGRNPLKWIVGKILGKTAVQVAKKITREDAAIYGEVQKGLEASPHRGVIGTREERIYPFQQFILDRTRTGPRELPIAAG